MSSDLDNLNSRQLWERAQKSLAGGVSHDGRYLPPHPTYFARAKGSRKWDVEGREYIDYAMGSGAMMLGHSHPDVVDAVQRQMELGTFFATVHPLEIAWAELVQELIPSAERVRFTASGTEATLLAIRTARAYSGRPKLLRFEGHFHGWHDGVLLGMKAPFDTWPSLGIPDELRSTVAIAPQDADRVEEMLKADSDIGTIICEVSGANWGSVPIEDQLLRDLRTIADRHGCVLIFDEVITGFRWSPGGKQKLLGVTPDLTTMAKIVAGGMPGGAIGGKAEIMRLLDPAVAFGGYKPAVVHKGTYNASPIVCAAAVAALKVIRTGEPQRQADSVARQLRTGLQQMIDQVGVDALVYGESSAFHLYFSKGARRCALGSISPAAIRSSLNRDSLDIYVNGLRMRGVDNMSFTGGMTSLAHRDEDVEPTIDAFRGAVQDLLDAGRVHRI
jgi:glutamate-1-semialdehyde 2,1-aminomutase